MGRRNSFDVDACAEALTPRRFAREPRTQAGHRRHTPALDSVHPGFVERRAVVPAESLTRYSRGARARLGRRYSFVVVILGPKPGVNRAQGVLCVCPPACVLRAMPIALDAWFFRTAKALRLEYGKRCSSRSTVLEPPLECRPFRLRRTSAAP